MCPYGDPVAAGDDAMEVSFDLEHGVVPPSFASQSEVASDSDLECFGDCVPEGVLFKE